MEIASLRNHDDENREKNLDENGSSLNLNNYGTLQTKVNKTKLAQFLSFQGQPLVASKEMR